MCRLDVHVLGRLEVYRDGSQVEGLNARRAQELLVYLLLHRDRPWTRETLAGQLWPQSASSQSMKNLRQTLWQLQSALACDVLYVDPEWVHLNAELDLWLDVIVFEQACTAVRDVPGVQMDAASAGMVKDALALYGGDLFDGCYQDWCLLERERLQRLYLKLLEKYMGYCEAHGDYETAIHCGGLALRCDVAHERTHRRLMRLHYLAGDRVAALRQYAQCVAFLRRELDVAPSEYTTALFGRIRAGQPLFPELDGDMPVESAPLSQLMTHLRRFQTTLMDAHQQLQAVIDAVEMTLRSGR